MTGVEVKVKGGVWSQARAEKGRREKREKGEEGRKKSETKTVSTPRCRQSVGLLAKFNSIGVQPL
jgi:hypothetical protein